MTELPEVERQVVAAAARYRARLGFRRAVASDSHRPPSIDARDDASRPQGAAASAAMPPSLEEVVPHRPAHAGLVCLGIVGAVVALLGAILVFATRDFGFSVDIDQLYSAAYADRDEPEMDLARIAESHRQRRVENREGVRWLQRYLVGGLRGRP